MSDFEFLKPIVKMLGIVAGGILFLLLIVGGIIFWMPNIPNIVDAFASSGGNQNQLETAQQLINSMKRMVSDSNAWATAVKEENDRLSTRQESALIIPQPCTQQTNNIAQNYIEAKTSPRR